MFIVLDTVPFPKRLVPNTVMLISEKGLHLVDDISKPWPHIPCTQFDNGIVVKLQTSPDRASV